MILSCSNTLANELKSPYVKAGFEIDCVTMRKKLEKDKDSEIKTSD